MLLAALPGRAVQLAHAILAAGYDLVVPVSWGEELLAEHALRELEHAPSHAMVFCSCPLVRDRLLASGNEIVPHLLSTVAPPVATARYLRALQPDVAMRITYLGACPGAAEHSIDAQMHPQDVLRHLEQRSIAIVRQPMVFESTVPPDRRRHWSVPGGAPSADAMRARGLLARFVTIGPDVALDVAEAILAADRVLLDVAPTQGCACAGAVEVHQVEGSREAVIALEPPRSHLPVIDVEPRVAVAQPMPHLTGHAVSRPLRPGAAATHATRSHITSIQEAALGRAERRRIAITPPHISTTDPRSRPTAQATPKSSPVAAQSRRMPAATQRSEPARKTEPESGVASARVEMAAPLPPTPAGTEVVASPSVEPPRPLEEPVTPPAPPLATLVEQESTPSQVSIGVRRRTPAYEMQHVARTRTHTGETPRVPRAYAAVRPRARGAEAGSAHEEGAPEAMPGGTPVSPNGPVVVTPPLLEAAAAIPIVVEPPPVGAERPPEDPGTRGVTFAPRLERRDVAPRARGRAWIVALAAVIVVGAAVYALLR